MFKFSYKTIIATAAVAIIGFSSCQKEAMEMQVKDFFTTESETQSNSSEQSSSEEVDALSMRIGDQPGSCNPMEKLPDCATVTESGETFPKTITIDFGSGCTDLKGRSKQGKIIVLLSNAMNITGATRTVTFEDFKVGDVSIEGERKMVNIGTNSAGHYVFEKTVNTTHNGPRGIMERTFIGEEELISGFEADDCNRIFYLSGSGKMVDPKGNVHTRTIIEPLLIDRACKHPKSGIVEMTGMRGEATIDFGSGDCDNIAMVTKDGETNEINLDEAKVHCRKGGK